MLKESAQKSTCAFSQSADASVSVVLQSSTADKKCIGLRNIYIFIKQREDYERLTGS